LEQTEAQRFVPAGFGTGAARLRLATVVELRRAENWLQLLSFCAVGSTGYVVNLVAYSILLSLGLGFMTAAVGSFLVAVANNYALNRTLTFRSRRGSVAVQGARYLSVSVLGLGFNLALLATLVRAGLPPVPAQACAIVLVTPLSFLGNRLWSFRR
jgi:dolichol-phosphate mannosyltransferase